LDTGIKAAQSRTGRDWNLESKSLDEKLHIEEQGERLEVFGNCLCQRQAIGITQEGKRNKSNRPHIFHVGRADVQAWVRRTAAGLPGDLAPLHHRTGNPRRALQAPHTRTHSSVWETGRYLFVPMQP